MNFTLHFLDANQSNKTGAKSLAVGEQFVEFTDASGHSYTLPRSQFDFIEDFSSAAPANVAGIDVQVVLKSGHQFMLRMATYPSQGGGTGSSWVILTDLATGVTRYFSANGFAELTGINSDNLVIPAVPVGGYPNTL